MTAADLREVPTVEALVEHVREGVEELVREALAEAESLRSEADAKLERYDEIVHEMTSLRGEVFGLRRDLEGIPERINKARLDALIPDGGGEDPALLERRYVVCRERLPVAEQRLGRLEEQLASITSGGSRPAKVDPSGGERKLVKHTAREPALDVLNETVAALERLRADLPDAVKDATTDLHKERNTLLAGQDLLWGQSKA